MNTMLHTSQPTIPQHTEAQRAHALEMINVSQGITRPSEVPLWVGKSTLLHPKNQTRLVMGVSKDKDWFWLRFSHDLKPEDNALLVSEGFSYSKKTRLGYSCATSPAVAKFIRRLGYDGCAHFTYVPPVKPVAKQAAVSTPNEGVAKGKVTSKETHMMDGLRYVPSSNRWIDSKGHFVKPPTEVGMVKENGKVVQAQEVETPLPAKLGAYEVGFKVGKFEALHNLGINPDNAYTGDEFDQYIIGYLKGYRLGEGDEAGVSEAEVEVQMAADQYQAGYEAGVVDGEDEEFTAAYDVDALARVMGMTVTELHERVGTGYVDGWLTGFAETRPAPVRKGIKSLLGK